MGGYTEAGRQLGVVFSDYDDDGDPDLYVANDGMANFLFNNDGKGFFTEVGMVSGVALNNGGRPEAGMGTDFGDYDGDGDFDLNCLQFSVGEKTGCTATKVRESSSMPQPRPRSAQRRFPY